MFNLPLFKKPKRDLIAQEIVKLRDYKDKNSKEQNVTATRVMDKKTKEIMKIDNIWPDDVDDIYRRKLHR